MPDDPLLALLREHYGNQWRIRRTAHLWIATSVDREADHAPTLVEPDVDAFVRHLESPPPRAGRSRSLLSAPWVASRLAELDAGVHWGGPPEG